MPVKNMVLEFLATYTDVASLVLRVFVGILMIIHGFPKLFSKEARTQMIPAMKGMGIPRIGFELAGILETFGGLALLVGFLVRIAGILFAIEMVATTWLYLTKLTKVPMPRGALEPQFKATHGYLTGWELDTVILASAIALMILGGGAYSLDALLGI